MKEITGTEPAFPIADTPYTQTLALGLTIRQHFAAMAMQGLLSNHTYLQNQSYNNQNIAHRCVEVADALIVELNKPTTP